MSVRNLRVRVYWLFSSAHHALSVLEHDVGMVTFWTPKSEMCPKCDQNVPKMCPKPKYVQNVTKMCLKVTNVPKMHPNLALSLGTFWTCLRKMTKGILYVQNVTIMCPKHFCLISISLELPQCAQNMSKYLDTFWSYFGTVYKKVGPTI